MPLTTSVLDNFNRANGAIGTNWTVNPFNDASPTPTIASNECKIAASGGYSEIWWNAASFANTAGLECFIKAGSTLPSKAASGSFNGYYVALIQQPNAASSTADGYQVGFLRRTGTNADKYVVFKYTNDVSTTILAEANLGTDIAVGDVLGMSLSLAGVISIYKNGTVIATVTDTTYFHAGESAFLSPAVVDSSNAATFDDFGGGQTSGTTPVSKTLTASYNIIQQIVKTLAPAYAVRFIITKNLATSYNVKQQIAKTRSVSYNIITRVTKTLASSYNVGAAPINTVAPTISGSPLTGQLLTASTGTWSNSPTSFTYQWQVETAPGSGVYADISGETASTLQL